MTKKERFDTFVKELGELTKKYDIEIWGCGCCGSPSLFDLKNEKATISEDLAWNDEKSDLRNKGKDYIVQKIVEALEKENVKYTVNSGKYITFEIQNNYIAKVEIVKKTKMPQ